MAYDPYGWDQPYNIRQPGTGWEFVTNPMGYLPEYEKWQMQQNKPTGTTTYTFGAPRTSWYGGQPGLAPPPPGTGQWSFSGGGGAGQGGGGAAGGAGGGGANFGNVVAGTSTTAPTTAGAGGGMAGWWGSNWKDVLGAAAGAYSSYADAQAAKNASRNAGKVDLWSESNPWGPSTDYRTAGMAQALEMLRNQAAAGQADRGGGGGGGGGRANEWWNAFQGATGNTNALLEDLRRRGEQGHALYGPANQFTMGLLAGQDPNAYRQETYGLLRDYDDPDLRRYKDMLFAGQMPGTAADGGLGLTHGRSSGYRGGGGGGGAGTGPIGIEKYIKDILEGKYLNNNPNLQAQIDASTRGIQQKFMEEAVPGVTTQFAGAGRLGSGAWANALAQAERERATALGDTVAGIRQQDYEARMADIQNALNQGTAFDMNAINAAAQRAAAGASAGAAQYAADKESADRMALARMNALQGAIGMGQDWQQFRFGGMGSLADMYGRDQMAALSMVPELSGLDVRDLSAAAEASIASDQLRGQYGLGMANLADQRRARNASLGWQREQYNREEPWKRMMQYSDIINAMSGGYGTQHEYGIDQRNVSPYGGSPWGQALAGGLAGWYAGQRDQQSRG